MTAADLADRLAREYLRVSEDKTGNLASPDEQHDENAEHAARNGWRLGDPYREREAVSASRWSGRERDEFARLLGDIEGGRFAADILIIWESSRGSRKVGEWVRLIDGCETASVLIYVTTHGRLYDCANPRDRRTLLEDAVDSEYESAKTRKRVIRSTTARAAKGLPHGRTRYGYQRTYDPVTRRLVSEDKHPEESANVAELFRRLHAGDSLRSVERDWEARGIVTRGQRNAPPHPFRAVDLRGMALNAAYAGLRVRQPKGAKRVTGSVDEAVPAKWPAIVTPEVYYAVRAILTDPSRRKSRPGGAKHLMSMIAGCGECGDVVSVRYRDGERFYQCRGARCVFVVADELDEIAEAAIFHYLSRPEMIGRMQPPPGALPELAAVRAEITAAQGSLADYRRRAGLLQVTAESFAAIEPAILAEIGRLTARERELQVPHELAGWPGPVEEVEARWRGSLLGARRNVARKVLSPQFAGTLLIARVGVKGQWNPRVPVARRVRLDRGTGA